MLLGLSKKSKVTNTSAWYRTAVIYSQYWRRNTETKH